MSNAPAADVVVTTEPATESLATDALGSVFFAKVPADGYAITATHSTAAPGDVSAQAVACQRGRRRDHHRRWRSDDGEWRRRVGGAARWCRWSWRCDDGRHWRRGQAAPAARQAQAAAADWAVPQGPAARPVAAGRVGRSARGRAAAAAWWGSPAPAWWGRARQGGTAGARRNRREAAGSGGTGGAARAAAARGGVSATLVLATLTKDSTALR